MNLRHPTLSFLVAVLLAGPALANNGTIPLEDFFRDPTFDDIVVSPDGSKVAALSTWKDHLNLYVIDLRTKRPTQLTGLDTMDVTDVRWVGNDRLIFTGMEDGFLTGGLFAVDADGRNSRALARSVKQQANEGVVAVRMTEFLDYYGKSTTEILVVSNERRALDPDVYRLDIRTGIKHLVARNPGNVRFWVADGAGAVRAAFAEEGRKQYLLYREKANDEWREVKRWDFLDGTIQPLAFDSNNHLLYVADSRGRDTAAICLLDPATGQVVRQLYADDTYDTDRILLSRVDQHLLGYVGNTEKRHFVWADEQMKKLQTLVDQSLPGTLNEFYSWSLDRTWLVIRARSDRDPGTFYLLNARKLTMEKLVSRAGWIQPAKMAVMKPIQYRSRDGLTIHGYLTLPPGSDGHHLPMVVNPHGGPWVRDGWGYIPEVQFLASRGYAVLQVNFRGSTGYGRKFLEAGYRQWGLAMQDDITDGVHWAINQGIADPRRIAIYGASYGGYAAMAGLAFTPDLYCCGIDYVGVTDIKLLLRTIPQGWERVREQIEAMTGNGKQDRDQLEATSPLLNADKIRVPVFFAYGELDDRVNMKHATRLAAILRQNDVPVDWMVRSNEGHGYRRWKNKIAFYREMEKFLAEYLSPPRTATVKTGDPKVLQMPAESHP